MKLYKVIDAHSISDLEKQVTSYMNMGWKPQGGVCYFGFGGLSTTDYFYQAMIKESKNE